MDSVAFFLVGDTVSLIIMVQWKMGVSPIFLLPFIWGNLPLKHDYGRKGNLHRSKLRYQHQKEERNIIIDSKVLGMGWDTGRLHGRVPYFFSGCLGVVLRFWWCF